MLRQRNLNRGQPREPGQHPIGARNGGRPDEADPVDKTAPAPFSDRHDTAATDMSSMVRKQPVWLLLAVASGSCAAFNGVFAKLTTTALTTSWSHAIAQALSLSPDNTVVEFLIRGLFFGLNLVFNVAMWSLFTAALTRASSTTRVSIVNVSANFFCTAFLGLAIFGERLPPMWWVGAGLLAAGNVVIGRREESEKLVGAGAVARGEAAEEEEGQVLLGEGVGQGGPAAGVDGELGAAETTKEATHTGEDVDDPVR